MCLCAIHIFTYVDIGLHCVHMCILMSIHVGAHMCCESSQCLVLLCTHIGVCEGSCSVMCAQVHTSPARTVLYQRFFEGGR